MVGETRLGGKNGGGLVKFRKVTRCRLKNLNSSEVGGAGNGKDTSFF